MRLPLKKSTKKGTDNVRKVRKSKSNFPDVFI